MRLFGLIGYPLSHSFSRDYFVARFAEKQIPDADYRLFPIENISQLNLLIGQNPDLIGLNVTIPHKVSILRYLDELSDEAAAIGAVNCIRITRENSDVKLSGFNTDAFGFAASLKPLLKPWHTSALVLGTGGASRAVCYALKMVGIDLLMVSRMPSPGQITYQQVDREIIENHLLIINTTPLGMFPGVETAPEIPYNFVGERHLLFDLVYNPAETLFLKKGKAQGAITKNGLEMLRLQADRSWEIWNRDE